MLKSHVTKTSMIFAAGLGTRLKPLTDHIPKPLVKVHNKPIIQHIIEQLIEEGITHFIINGHYLKEQLFDFLDSYQINLPSHIKITKIYEDKLKENGGSMYDMLPFVEEELFIGVNADIIWNKPIVSKMLKIWDPNKMDVVISLVDKNIVHYRESGDVGINEEGKIIWDKTGGWIYSGIQLLARSFVKTINLQSPFKSTEIWKLSLNPTTNLMERVFGAKMSGNWVEVMNLKVLEEINASSLRNN